MMVVDGIETGQKTYLVYLCFAICYEAILKQRNRVMW